MMKFCFAAIFLLLIFGCSDNSSSKNVAPETTSSGTIRISVDESFQPVIMEQIKVFESSYPKAKIIAEYKSEADCFRDLQSDSTRMIIVSRGLTDEEAKLYKNKLQFNAIYAELAYDAIAVVVNNSNPDSVFSLTDLKGLLAGTGNKKYNVVVDGKNATSTVRYLIDSVLRGTPLGQNVTAAKNSDDVVNHVANNPSSIGFVGTSWIANPQEEKQREYLTKVKMALIECKSCDKDTYAKPSQQTIMFHQYPLVRGLHYVLKENISGLGSGFLNFMSLERGQLIFRRAYLVPAKMQFYRRSTKINNRD
ncbi:MAG TPA: substrate-binding domain-containing protein [Segetibacter sp.]|jgi:phosphate transport system substrate-binding protein